jgi:hypothetical protein
VRAGGNAVEPEELIKQAQLEGEVEVAVERRPGEADEQRPFEQRGVYEEAERRKQDKKKATPNTCSRISA